MLSSHFPFYTRVTFEYKFYCIGMLIVMITWCNVHGVLLDSVIYKHVCNFASVTQLVVAECIWNKQLKVGNVELSQIKIRKRNGDY